MDEQTITNADQMKRFGAEMAKIMQAGEVWLLHGELGSGKTTFVQGLALALGVNEKVTSPTFNISAAYPVPLVKGIEEFVHVDLYRLSAEEAANDPAVRSLQEDVSHRLIVVEWGERWPKMWFRTGEIRFEHADSGRLRKVNWLKIRI